MSQKWLLNANVQNIALNGRNMNNGESLMNKIKNISNVMQQNNVENIMDEKDVE